MSAMVPVTRVVCLVGGARHHSCACGEKATCELRYGLVHVCSCGDAACQSNASAAVLQFCGGETSTILRRVP